MENYIYNIWKRIKRDKRKIRNKWLFLFFWSLKRNETQNSGEDDGYKYRHRHATHWQLFLQERLTAPGIIHGAEVRELPLQFALILRDSPRAFFRCWSRRKFAPWNTRRDIGSLLRRQVTARVFREATNRLFVSRKKEGRLKKRHVGDNVFMYSVCS